MSETTRRKSKGIAVLFAIWVIVGAVAFDFVHKREERFKNTWTAVAEGTYDHVDYGHFDRTWQSSHGLVHHVTVDTTLVFFDDGHTCAMEGRYGLPFPKGTRIRVQQNGMGWYRIEKTGPQ